MTPQSLLQGYVEISSLPMMFVRITEAINNPRTSVNEISKIISEDPGLTARLLRVVNSAFYNFPTKIDTISRAVTIVGTQQLRDLALATSVIRLFKGIPRELVNMESFWRHSIACGAAARTFAAYRRESNIERFFVAGILHDLGRLVIFGKIPDQAREALAMAEEKNISLLQAERTVLGFDHALVGRALLQQWKLPNNLVDVVSYHHLPTNSVAFPNETAIIHIADIFAHTLGLGASGERSVPAFSIEAWDLMGMQTSIIPSVIKEVERQYDEAIYAILSE
ncbi:MAG TPA: HDOD domain-containing protein [Bacteroidota bacterium]|nr:HDOD domain-containing protein [Bacteroidota bacterium]